MNASMNKILPLLLLAAVVFVSGCTQTGQTSTTTTDTTGSNAPSDTGTAGQEAAPETEGTNDNMMGDNMDMGHDVGSEAHDAMMDEAQDTQETQTEAQTATKVFKLTGQSLRFFMDGQESPELRVKQGDTVRIEFTSTGGFHDWTVDEFNAATDRVNTGATATVEFVAGEKGTFEYYCSVGNHRAGGMKGNLVVE